MHRDLKPANILIDDSTLGLDQSLKITDFGLSRSFIPGGSRMTNSVVTLWYRAPELLLGSKYYTTAIDVWSAGCVFAELLTGSPIFPGSSGVDQLVEIIKVSHPHTTITISIVTYLTCLDLQ